jgi:hypothetical protein
MVEENVQTARLPIGHFFQSHDEDVDWVNDAAAQMIDPSKSKERLWNI